MTLPVLSDLIAKAADGQALTEAEATAAFEDLMSGSATPVQIAALLVALRVRGETVAEITGAARVMRAKALAVAAPLDAIDTCGTGGTGLHTLNISTAVGFVVAGAGVPVAKHGNRAVSSRSGSADVLESLGVHLAAPAQVMEQAIAQAGIGFLLAPKHHAAMKHVMPVRNELATRTVFNLLGPLANPAGAKRQLMGVYHRDWVKPLAEVLRNLGSEQAWVVHGDDGLDELTTTGPTHVAELKDGNIRTFMIRPEEVGLPEVPFEALLGGDPADNAAALRALLDGATGPYRDIVLFNAGAALMIAGKAADLDAGMAMAADAIDTGRARTALDRLVAITNQSDAGMDEADHTGTRKTA